MTEEELLQQSTITTNELYLAELGSFEDDPSADDVYVFALKMNANVVRLDDTISKANSNTEDLEMLRQTGLFGQALYGGRLGTPLA
jgi:hypothetical protein